MAKYAKCEYWLNPVAEPPVINEAGKTIQQSIGHCALLEGALGNGEPFAAYQCAEGVCRQCQSRGAANIGTNPHLIARVLREAAWRCTQQAKPEETFPLTEAVLVQCLKSVRAYVTIADAVRIATACADSRPDCLKSPDGSLDTERWLDILDRAGILEAFAEAL